MRWISRDSGTHPHDGLAAGIQIARDRRDGVPLGEAIPNNVLLHGTEGARPPQYFAGFLSCHGLAWSLTPNVATGAAVPFAMQEDAVSTAFMRALRRARRVYEAGIIAQSPLGELSLLARIQESPWQMEQVGWIDGPVSNFVFKA